MTPAEIERAFAGDQAAKQRLAEAILDMVYAEVEYVLRPLAARTGRDARQDVEDLTQAVMVALFEGDGRVLRRWEPARGMSLRSFVGLVTRRRVFRAIAGFRGNLWAVTPMSSEQLDRMPSLQRDETADVEYALLLDSALHKLDGWLDERGRRLFHAIYVAERDIKDVSAHEGMTVDAVHAWCARLRKKVRELRDPTQGRTRNVAG